MAGSGGAMTKFRTVVEAEEAAVVVQGHSLHRLPTRTFSCEYVCRVCKAEGVVSYAGKDLVESRGALFSEMCTSGVCSACSGAKIIDPKDPELSQCQRCGGTGREQDLATKIDNIRKWCHEGMTIEGTKHGQWQIRVCSFETDLGSSLEAVVDSTLNWMVSQQRAAVFGC